ncbi:MAG: hypothetical protein ACPGTU_17915, partial [Myxococcota bacterium]
LIIFGVFASMVIGYKLVSEFRLKQEKVRSRPLLERRRKDLESDLMAVRDELVAKQSDVVGPP